MEIGDLDPGLWGCNGKDDEVLNADTDYGRIPFVRVDMWMDEGYHWKVAERASVSADSKVYLWVLDLGNAGAGT